MASSTDALEEPDPGRRGRFPAALLALGYDELARYYELEYADYDRDLPFYHELIRRTSGPFLDLGCGTGRVARSLAEAGFEAVGLDSSEDMLAIGRSTPVANLQLLRGDMRGFDLGRAFPLVAITLNAFMHVIDLKDQLATLRSAARHVTPNGLFVISTINPYSVSLQDTEAKLIHEFTMDDPLAGSRVSKFSAREVDTADQIERVTFFYDEVKDGQLRRTVTTLDFRYTYRYELELLLQRAGLRVTRVYGGYDLEPYDITSSVLLMVAEHAPA